MSEVIIAILRLFTPRPVTTFRCAVHVHLLFVGWAPSRAHTRLIGERKHWLPRVLPPRTRPSHHLRGLQVEPTPDLRGL